MHRWPYGILLTLGLLACSKVHDLPSWQAPAIELPRLAAPLPESLLSSSPSRALVDLRRQIDIHALGQQMSNRGLGKAERRRTVIDALVRLAHSSQQSLFPRLEGLRSKGQVLNWQGYAVVNRLEISATPNGWRAIAEWPEVAVIVEETPSSQPKALTNAGKAKTATRHDNYWALEAVNVPSLWRMGLDGRDVLIGLIDSGATAIHEQLAPNFRGGKDSWKDPTQKKISPHDRALGHGSGVLSLAVSANVQGRNIGAAPSASWIACAALPDGKFNNVLMNACADWMLRVGQPDILINAWELPTPGCDRSLRRTINAWRAAEILPIFAAGNDGLTSSSDRSPANYTDLYPGKATALSVGGFTPSGDVFQESSSGPNSCDDRYPYPSISAPAQELITALPLSSSTYTLRHGTSFAAGLVAGASALLLQKYPEASVSDLERALVQGAEDDGVPGTDLRFGHGRLNVAASLEALRRSQSPVD